jgi:hypothetical protein
MLARIFSGEGVPAAERALHATAQRVFEAGDRMYVRPVVVANSVTPGSRVGHLDWTVDLVKNGRCRDTLARSYAAASRERRDDATRSLGRRLSLEPAGAISSTRRTVAATS